MSDFPVLFKADLIFKDFSRKLSKFKYFHACANPGVNQNLCFPEAAVGSSLTHR